MRKAIAVLRTLVLAAVVVLIIWNTPGDVFGSPDSMVQVRRIQGLWKVSWVAVGWIALEAAVTWLLVLRAAKGAQGAQEKRAAREAEAPPKA